MTNWVVSGHGWVEMNSRSGQPASASGVPPMINLPSGITIHWFCPEGTALSVADGWKLYKALVLYDPPLFGTIATLGSYYEEQTCGHVCQYVAVGDTSWIEGNGRPASGIFKAGDKDHKSCTYFGRPNAALPGTPTASKLDLGAMLTGGEVKSGDHIFWLCCRIWNR